MKKLLLRSLVAGSFAFAACAAYADDDDLFDDRFYVAPMGSLTGNRNDSNFQDGFGGGLAIGKSVVPHLGLELVGDYLRYRGKTSSTPTTGVVCGLLGSCPNDVNEIPSQTIYGGGIGLNYYTSKENKGFFFHADAEAGDHFVYNAGLAFDQPFLNRMVYMRAELLYHKETNYDAAPLFKLGVRIPLGGLHAPAQEEAAAPVQVVPVEQPAPAPEVPPPPAPTCQPPAAGQPVSFEGCKVGDTIVLHGVNFEFNKATLTLNAKTLLDQVADALLARKDIKVEVDGHTDGIGSDSYNLKLSDARAASVMNYLVSRGVERNRMTSKGFGKSMPVADNSTDEGREQNRRVELKVTESGSAAASSSEGQPASAEAPAAPAGDGAPAQSEAAPAPAPEPAPVKKHGAKHRKQAAAAEAAPAAEAPAPQAESVPAPAEPAPADSNSSSATPPASGESAAQPTASPAPASSDDSAAPTEPAPAPPDASSPQADKPK